MKEPAPATGSDNPPTSGISELAHRIGSGVKTLAQDQVKLAGLELMQELKAPLADIGAIMLGGMLAVIAFALLCATGVVALEPLIEPLWLRMLIMSLIYFVVERSLIAIYARELRRDTPPSLPRAKHEAERTVAAIEEVAHDD